MGPALRTGIVIVVVGCTAALAATGCARTPDAATEVPAAAIASVVAELPGPATGASAPAPFVDPFPGRRDVRVDELLTALAAEVETLAAAPAVRRDYERFLARHGLADEPTLYRDYVRVRLAFEATRAGGWWGLRWQITDEQPQSDAVWAQWRTLRLGEFEPLPDTTAVAECDELSALFAFVAHGLGLSRRSEVGLFWPTANHTVAVWTLDRTGAKPVRVVVPTSQIFLAGSESLGTAQFDAWAQPAIYDYRRQDAAGASTLPAPLARQFVLEVRTRGGQAQDVAQTLRNLREQRQGGG